MGARDRRLVRRMIIGAGMSPAQLAQLDRALTPAEQAIVDAYQSNQADADLAAERAKPGVKAVTETMHLDPLTLRKPSIYATAPISVSKGDDVSTPWWQIALGVLGVSVIGYGVYRVYKR